MDPVVSQKLAAILDKVKKEKLAYWFMEPVNWQEMGLYDYLEIIKEPMDLGTITAVYDDSLKLQKIANDLKNQFYADLELSKAGPGSAAADEAARKKQKRRADQLESEGLVDDTGTFREKARLCRRISKLRPENLGSVIRAIRAEFPDAIQVVGADRITVNIDLFSQAALVQVSTLVRQKLKDQYRAKQAAAVVAPPAVAAAAATAQGGSDGDIKME